MIARERRTKDEIEGRIRKCETTAHKVVSYRADNGLMFDGRSLDDVLVYKLSADCMQKPPTNGPVASST